MDAYLCSFQDDEAVSESLIEGGPGAFDGLSCKQQVVGSIPAPGSKSSIKSGSRNTLIVMFNDEDRAILEFERGWWLEPGPKDRAIELSLGLPASEYYEQLIRIVALPASARFDPLTVARIRAMIEPEATDEEAAS